MDGWQILTVVVAGVLAIFLLVLIWFSRPHPARSRRIRLGVFLDSIVNGTGATEEDEPAQNGE